MTSPDLDQVLAWCEEHDQHPTEGWLCMLLDGSISVDELRAAIVEKREARSRAALNAKDKALIDQILKLPSYRGWEITTDDHPETQRDTLVWEHDGGTEVTVWCLFDHPRGLDIGVYDRDDPSDLEGWVAGALAPMPTDANQFFAACKKFLDDQLDAYEDLSKEYPAP